MTEQLYSPERRPDLDNLFEYFTTRMTRAMHVCFDVYGRYGPFDSFSRHHIELAGPMDDHIRIVGCRYRPAGDSLMRENIFLDCLIDQHGNLVGSRVDDISGGDPLYYLQHILSHSFQPHGFHVFPVREQLHPHLAMAA